MKVYIAGPMRGLPDFNYPTFNSLEAWIREYGLEGVRTEVVYPVNPVRNFGGDSTREYAEYMRADLPQLAKCDAIVLLPGWENSQGATLEAEIARHLGLRFFYAQPAEPDTWEIREGEVAIIYGTRRCPGLGCPGRAHCLTDTGYGLLCHDEGIHQASRERMLKAVNRRFERACEDVRRLRESDDEIRQGDGEHLQIQGDTETRSANSDPFTLCKSVGFSDR